ncbi:MAG: Rpn family recombination-promoting nuclease/putative transposase [Myxococcota bacterium]
MARGTALHPNPHDAFFKATFGLPEHAAGELACVLPPDVAAQFDLSTLRRVASSYATPGEADRHADVLLSVGLRDEPGEGLVYVLLEHQSTSERWMVLRMLRYLVRVWEHWLREHPTASGLPPIVPVVVSHDPGGWRGPVGLDEALAAGARSLEAMREHLPLFRMVVDDLSTVGDAELRRRAMSAMGRLALGLLKHARRFDVFFGDLAHWAGTFREVMAAPEGLSALGVVLNYMHLINDQVPQERVAEHIGALLGQEAKEAYVTEGERLIQQGLEKGLQQGLQTGLAQGRRDLLRHLLERRFGAPLPDEAIVRLNEAAIPELDRWAERVLTATSLEDVLKG